MKERIRLLCRTLRQGSSAVTAIVTGCRGATPRSPGALLVLTAETALGTVGGGQAEHDIIGPAMEMLRGGAPVQQGWHQCLSAQELRHMGQEFGGEEEILLLRWEPRDLPLAEALLSAMGQNADCSLRLEYDKVHWRGTLLPIAEAHTAPGCFTLKLQEGGRCYVFGGGHVSQALVPLLSGVDFCCVVLDELGRDADGNFCGSFGIDGQADGGDDAAKVGIGKAVLPQPPEGGLHFAVAAYHANVPHWAAKHFAQHLIIALVPPCHNDDAIPCGKGNGGR